MAACVRGDLVEPYFLGISQRRGHTVEPHSQLTSSIRSKLPHEPASWKAHGLANSSSILARARSELLQRSLTGKHVEQAVVIEAMFSLARNLLLVVDG